MLNTDSADEMLLKSRIAQQLQALAEKSYSIQDDFFSIEECTALRQEILRLEKQGELKPAAIGRGQQQRIMTQVRGDFIHWLDESTQNPTELVFFKRLELLRESLNQDFFMGLRSFEAHYALYPPGQGYQKHLDQHAGTRARKVTFILYLNPDWQTKDGGELMLYHPDRPDELLTQIQPFAGRFVLFRSELFPHAVAKCFGIRTSLTGWFRDDKSL